MVRTFIDVRGLTTREDPSAYLVALGLHEGEPISEGGRLQLLSRLRDGAGVVVLTGPEGAPFWSLASIEVKVRIVPDDTEYTYRAASDAEWSYRAVGFNAVETRQLLNRKSPVPAGDRRYSLWLRARDLLAALGSLGDVEPLVVETYPTEQISIGDAVARLERNHDPLALDWEWSMETTEPVGLAFGTPDMASYAVVKASDVDEDGTVLVDAFGRYLLNGQPAILHGGRADLGTQLTYDALDLHRVADMDDTMVMAYLCGEPILALKDLTRKYLGRDPVDFPGELSDLPAALGARYAAGDGRNTYDLFGVLARTLVEREQWSVYRDIERPIIPIIVSMEQEGIPVDLDAVKHLYRDTVAIEQGIRRAIIDHWGLDVADDSGKTLETNQARRFVAAVRGQDPGGLDQRMLTTFPEGEIDLLLLHRRSRTLRRNFLGRALKYWYAATHPGHERHLFNSRKRFTAKRQLTDLGKFLEWKRRWEGLADREQFRYFPRYNQAGSMDGENRRAPRSGRLSSTDPNFQQQPRTMRDVFVPPADTLWWSFDYSGLELHIAAGLSGDREMRRILGESCPDPKTDGSCGHRPKHGDLHGYLQYKVKDMTGGLYDRAVVIKPFNFMELYGGSPKKGVEIIAKARVYIPLSVAEEIDAGHHAAFAGYWEWAEERHDFHRRMGYAETIYGRRRYEPDVRSRDPERVSYALRALLNHEIQGSAADVVKIAMDRHVPIVRRYGAHTAAQVHDELDGWTTKLNGMTEASKTQYLAEFKALTEEILTGVEVPGVKLKVEGGYGTSWGRAH